MRRLPPAICLFTAIVLGAARGWAFEPGIVPVVSSAAEAGHLIKGAPGNLYSLYVTTGATAGFVMTFDAASAPADGPVTPVECVVAPPSSTVSISFSGPPDIYRHGIVAVFSTTGCFTKTANPTAFFKARAQ
ncbi:MAG TPA: hypothetical protein VFQ82_14340 [Stellaceae bacterium]|jgi:hypothetical protein|nr:hypothetical protein [Stellaceae bacterium]